VLEVGRPPRRRLPRKVALGIKVAGGIVAVGLVGATVLAYISDTVDTESPTLVVEGQPVLSFESAGAEFGVNLSNDSDTPIVIDNVTVIEAGTAEAGVDPWAPGWVAARVLAPRGESTFDAARQGLEVAGNGGAVGLVVTVNPPCGHLTPPALDPVVVGWPRPAEIVVGWHTESGELGQILLPDLLNDGPTSLEAMVSKVCGARRKVAAKFGPQGLLSPNTSYAWLVDGARVSFTVPTGGWERFGDVSINKDTSGPQGAEAMIFWTDLVASNGIHSCGQWWGAPDGTMADYAEHASNTRGTELVRGPSAVLVGGRTAQHLVLSVDRNVGCDPGFLYSWPAVESSALWTRIDPGDTIQVWIVDVDGKLIYIEADTHRNAGPKVEHEIEQIIESMRFD
jgi:hypothetical protein